jgi:D-3-phosphoglycerate dehydrogenase
MIDKKLMLRLKKSAVILNCARGGIVNEQDLYEILRDRKIAAAVVDVFRPEPPKKENPLITLDNILLTPHYAAITAEAGARSGIHAATGIDEVLHGKVPS